MRIASSTRRPRDRTRENIERKLSVCPASFNTTKVSKNTSGIVRVGTIACFSPTNSRRVPQTRNSVIIKSRVSPERSERICPEKSVVVCTMTPSGIAPDSFIDLRVSCPLSTRSMMDHPDFFTTERVTAGTGSAPERESRDSVSRLIGDSVTVAISRRKRMPGSPTFSTGIS